MRLKVNKQKTMQASMIWCYGSSSELDDPNFVEYRSVGDCIFCASVTNHSHFYEYSDNWVILQSWYFYATAAYHVTHAC